ncbi:MAG: hypothetical protein K0S01_413 [Herbinix sp.]|nr:hypothetical protein [Herbinix sp.]
MNNMKTILHAVFKLAMDFEILTVNPLLNARTEAKIRSVQKKKDDLKLYLENEMEILEAFLYQQETIEAYAILMDFQIGIRVGELVVLTKEDMLDNEVYIHKMEIVDEEKADGKYIRKGYKIVEFVKHDISSGYRTIPLTDKAQKILEEVKKLSEGCEYLFTQSNGERLASRSFNYWLAKYCRDAGSSFKSSNCIRRTIKNLKSLVYKDLRPFLDKRETGFEPATSALARQYSTTEPLARILFNTGARDMI